MTLLNFLILIWLGIVFPGFFYSIRLVRRSHQALAWLIANNLNGYRAIVARGTIYRGQIRMLISGCMVLMGLNAAMIQFYAPGSDMRQVLSASFRLLFILHALAFTYKSYLEDHELDLLINEDRRQKLRQQGEV